MRPLVIRHKVYIGATPSKVYELLTTSEGWNRWFTTNAAVECRPGGRIAFEWVNFGADHFTARDEGRILETAADRLLRFTWNPGRHETTVLFTLEPLGAGCIITVNESGHSDSPEDIETALDVACGWGEALTLLKAYLEVGFTSGPVPSS